MDKATNEPHDAGPSRKQIQLQRLVIRMKRATEPTHHQGQMSMQHKYVCCTSMWKKIPYCSWGVLQQQQQQQRRQQIRATLCL